MSILLDVKNLGISFGGLRAVNEFDLTIQKEQLYGLIGPNGAGKTTVFNLLTGVYKPDAGKVILDGNFQQFHSSVVHLFFHLPVTRKT